MVDWHRNTHPTREGGEHIPAQPLWVTIIRGVQFLFNLLVVALAGNAASYFYVSVLFPGDMKIITDTFDSSMAMVCTNEGVDIGLKMFILISIQEWHSSHSSGLYYSSPT